MTTRADKPDTDADIQLRKILDNKHLSSFIMVAGAGSGKTTSLVKALAHVAVARRQELTSRTQRIACITYTEIAAKEIYVDVGSDPLVHVATIHSFLWSVIKPFQRDISSWVSARAVDKLAKLEAEQAGFGPRVQEARRNKTAETIERLANQLDTIRSIDRFRYGTGSDYANGVLGHEDIINLVPQLILARPLLARLVAKRYPFIFVDESQDTLPEIVACLKHAEAMSKGKFCLGFFGDPMQQIYVRGVGEVGAEVGWSTIKKPENFRSPTCVLEVINHVRAQVDGLEQMSGLPAERVKNGEVTFIVLPADENRTQALGLARRWLAAKSACGAWTNESSGRTEKTLVIAHRMAARRLNFEGLYTAFHDNGSHSLSEAFDEGTAWPLAPFMKVIMPAYESLTADKRELMSILRQFSPSLRTESLKGRDVSNVLRAMADCVGSLKVIIETGGPGSVKEALKLSADCGLIELDPRLSSYFASTDAISDPIVSTGTSATIESYMQCDVSELRGYFRYIDEESPYSTHQGIKGAEFDDVLVVLDDAEGRHHQFSYDKLLGIKALSRADLEHQAAGEESTIDRTRRLFYVCASRATEALAVVLYAADVGAAVDALRGSGIPGAEEPLTLDSLRAASPAS
jgi:DNA helicase-2/ATP-dependent DNA helicase PcrA